MTDHEDRFAASLDALSRGEPPEPDDDLVQFVVQAQASWAEPTEPPSGSLSRLTARDRHRLWKTIHHEAEIKATVTHEGSFSMSASTLVPPIANSRPPGWAAVVARWQPVLSVAVMFAVLAGLIGVAYTGLNRRDNDPLPTAAGLIAQSTPTESVECVPYDRELKTFDDLSDMSMSDWPAREYTTVAVADPEIGRQAVEVYENWLNCARVLPAETSEVAAVEAIQQFWSDRGQYIFMLSRNPSFRPDELYSVRGGFSVNTILLNGALPLNRPQVTLVDPATGATIPAFGPGDVYELSDGRYGVIIGSITTDQLIASQTSGEVGSEEEQEGVWLNFLAFMEVDGQLLIDEYLGFCVVPSTFLDAGAAEVDACNPG